MNKPPADPTLSGFVDLQVNGLRGICFTDPGLALEQVQAASATLAERGTLAFCPTVITAGWDVYRRALPVLAQAARLPLPSRILGIHLEGPFISPEDGAVGAHPRRFTQPPSLRAFEELYALAEGRISVLTLAPELPGAVELVRRAVALGVAVGIGHTLAGEDDVRAVVDAGATLSTHLGNGIPNQIHRHHNPLWPQLAEPRLSAMLITDGHHLPPALIAAALRAKGAEGVIVTSDASPPAGLPPGDYEFFGTRARLEPPAPGAVCGCLRNLQAETLAGSAAMMIDCMNHLAGLGLLNEDELWRVGRDNPLKAIGKSSADLPAGYIRLSGGQFALNA